MGREEVAELFAAFGSVSLRKMFGGTAIYVGSRIVGMELDDAILIKGDAVTRAELEAAGLVQWAYQHAKTGKDVRMPYWTLPGEALDDQNQLQHLIGLAWAAACRAK